MTTKERLHHIVDRLPETELETAARVLEALAMLAGGAVPDDDEPVSDADRAAIEEGWADYRAGHGIDSAGLRRELGLDSTD